MSIRAPKASPPRAGFDHPTTVASSSTPKAMDADTPGDRFLAEFDPDMRSQACLERLHVRNHSPSPMTAKVPADPFSALTAHSTLNPKEVESYS